MIQGKNQYVLLGRFSHPSSCSPLSSDWPLTLALAVGSVCSLVWDTFSMWFGATTSELPDLETWLGLLDLVLNQTRAHCFLGSDPTGPTFNYLAKPCVIAEDIH